MHRVRQPQLKSQLVFNPSIDVTISVSGASVPFQSRFRAVSELFRNNSGATFASFGFRLSFVLFCCLEWEWRSNFTLIATCHEFELR